jgi:putative ABC transport system permease protein
MTRFPFRLLVKNLFKHPVRTTLTLGSLVVALFLITTLYSLLTTISAGVKNSRSDRIVTQSSVSLFVYMPEAYLPKIRSVDGVREAMAWNWFGGIYQDPKNFFAQFAVDHENLFKTYPEIKIIAGSQEDFENDRRACIVGKETAARFGWDVGSSVPLQGTIYPRLDGTAWDLRVAAIYESTSPNVDQTTLFFHIDYVRESQDAGAALGPDGVGVVIVLIEDDAEPVAVMKAIDQMFVNGPQKTLSTSESEFQAQFVSMLGNVPFFVGSIGGAVAFAILLAVLNTMLLSAREQTRDLGIMKALGFTGSAIFMLFFGQAIVLSLLGGGVGIGLAKLAELGIAKSLGTYFPGYTVLDETMRNGTLVALMIGIAAGLAPSILVLRAKVVDALRTEA